MLDAHSLTANRLSCCQLSTSKWTLNEDLIRYNTHGFDSLGIWRSKIQDIGIDQAIDLIHESPMSVSSVHWIGGFTGSDGQRLIDSMNDAVDGIRLASRLSAGCLIVHPGARNGHTMSHAHRLLSQATEKLLPIAEDYGVTLAIEPILWDRKSEWSFLKSLDANLKFISQFEHSNLKLVLDLFHVGLNSEVFERLHQFVDQIALVQLADRFSTGTSNGAIPWYATQRQMLGMGDVNIPRWINRLESLGYKGQYEVEVHGCSTDYFDMLDRSALFTDQIRIQPSQPAQPNSKPAKSAIQADAANQ